METEKAQIMQKVWKDHLHIIIQKCLCPYVMSRGLCDLTEAVCPVEERTLSISNNVNL